MRYIIFISLCFLSINASFLDQYNLFKAQSAFKQNDLNSSLEYYKKIKNKTDKIYYNMGNILYKQKKYNDAISYYKKITKDELQYKTLHNLGNSYALINDIQKAIQSYEKALELKDDNDTRFNLNLLKQKQKQQNQKNKDNKNNKQDKKDKENKKDNQQNKQNNQQKNNSQNDSKNKEDKKSQNKKEQNEKNKKEKQNEKEQEELQRNKMNKVKEHKLSDMEEKKWSKILENRGINTLLTPIRTKGEKDETTINPW